MKKTLKNILLFVAFLAFIFLGAENDQQSLTAFASSKILAVLVILLVWASISRWLIGKSEDPEKKQ